MKAYSLIVIVGSMIALSITIMGLSMFIFGNTGDQRAGFITFSIGFIFFLGILLPSLFQNRRPISHKTTDYCCPQCGYNMRGLTEAKCPECGAVFTLDQLRLK